MKQLPEKWAIKTDDPEFYKYFNKLPNVNKGALYPYKPSQELICYPAWCFDAEYTYYYPNNLPDGYELITIEQWREAVERDWKPVYKAKEKKRVPKSGWVIQVVGGLGIPILDGSTSRPALFNTQADCIEWVKKNGMLEEFYTFLEVDYITEE